MISCKVGSIGSAGHTQARRNGPFPRGQQAAHHKNKYMLPAGSRKTATPCLQPLAQYLGDGIADNGLVLVQHSMLENPD